VDRNYRFRTVHGFFIVEDIQMALVQQWVDIEVDFEVHQVVYAHQSGIMDLIRASCIRTLVGVMEEKDRGDGRRRATKMIVGALAELRYGWPDLDRGVATHVMA
jgi:hypothetical protein